LGLVGMVMSDLLGWNPGGLQLRDAWALPLGLMCLAVVAFYLRRPLRGSARPARGKH
jgi:hypothetical protein